MSQVRLFADDTAAYLTITKPAKSKQLQDDIDTLQEWELDWNMECARLGVNYFEPGRIAQSLTCLATDACLTADPGVASSIPARSLTFVESDHEIISTVILLPSADLFKKGCCQLQAKVCARITG